MDENFLEFWGNFLLSAARKKKQVDDMSTWMQKGLSNFEDFAGMFRKFYGLDQLSEPGTGYKRMTEKAMYDFQKSVKSYMGSMEFVPKREHLDLVEKYEKLKEKCADQEETIKHLRMLLNAKGIEQIQDIMKGQGELFQKMVKGFVQYFNKPELANEEGDQEPKKDDSELIIQGGEKHGTETTNG
jgi:hypothetical protein